MVVLRRFADDGAHRRHVEVLDPAAERVGHEAFGEGLQEGVIQKRVALLDRKALGLDVMVYVHVRLSTQGRDALAQFERAVRDRPEVLDCCTLTGEWDFCLRIVTHDMKEYESFFLDHLSKIPNVQSVNSSIVVTVIKESTVLPLARG